jgi:hypothetical protein
LTLRLNAGLLNENYGPLKTRWLGSRVIRIVQELSGAEIGRPERT